MPEIKIEVCANSLESAVNAQKGGAHRVELCANLYEGGTTPSPGEISLARELLHIDLNVLIRPRGGDFLYSKDELEIIRRDIQFCKKTGVDGVVFGFLKADGHIDTKLTAAFCRLARPMSVTFHRAFDMSKNHEQALEELAEIGVDRVLSSGAANKAGDGLELLHQLVEQAGSRIIVMPGSGIKVDNILEIIRKTGAKEYHVSERQLVAGKMTFKRQGIFMGGLPQIPEYEKRVIDAAGIEKIMRLVKKTK